MATVFFPSLHFSASQSNHRSETETAPLLGCAMVKDAQLVGLQSSHCRPVGGSPMEEPCRFPLLSRKRGCWFHKQWCDTAVALIFSHLWENFSFHKSQKQLNFGYWTSPHFYTPRSSYQVWNTLSNLLAKTHDGSCTWKGGQKYTS